MSIITTFIIDWDMIGSKLQLKLKIVVCCMKIRLAWWHQASNKYAHDTHFRMSV